MAYPQPLVDVVVKMEGLDIQGQMSSKDALALYGLAENTQLIVEVGSWKGCSTAIMAASTNGTIYAIDTWEGSEGTWLDEMAKKESVFDIFKTNLVTLGLWGRIRPMKMASQEAVKTFDDESIDMVFLDADHRYEFIKQDILAWLPKVKKGGILTGHDAELLYSELSENDKKAIGDFIGEDYIFNKDKPSEGIHPGVVKALYECFDDKHEIVGGRVWCYQKLM